MEIEKVDIAERVKKTLAHLARHLQSSVSIARGNVQWRLSHVATFGSQNFSQSSSRSTNGLKMPNVPHGSPLSHAITSSSSPARRLFDLIFRGISVTAVALD